MNVHIDENVAAIDQMDRAMDMMRTVWMALHQKDLLDDDALDSVAATLDRAIGTLGPVRELVNKMHGDN